MGRARIMRLESFMMQEKLSIGCVHNASIDELFRGIRSQMCNLITGNTLSLAP